MSHPPDHHLRITSCLDNGEHLHIVVADPATEHLLDFEVLPLPVSLGSVRTALTLLSERHLQRLSADDEDSVWLPCENELYAHRVPEEGNVIAFDPRSDVDASIARIAEQVPQDDTDGDARDVDRQAQRAERAEKEARWQREMAERLAPIMHLYTNPSPYRPAEPRAERRGGESS